MPAILAASGETQSDASVVSGPKSRKSETLTGIICSHRTTSLRLICGVAMLCLGTASKADRVATKSVSSIAATLAAEINRAITKHGGGVALREKVARRVAECTFLYNFASGEGADPETKEYSMRADKVDSEVLLLISSEISVQQFQVIAEAAKKYVEGIRNDHKAIVRLAGSCNAFNNPERINDAVLELTL
jgi:hypothetical protein